MWLRSCLSWYFVNKRNNRLTYYNELKCSPALRARAVVYKGMETLVIKDYSFLHIEDGDMLNAFKLYSCFDTDILNPPFGTFPLVTPVLCSSLPRALEYPSQSLATYSQAHVDRPVVVLALFCLFVRRPDSHVHEQGRRSRWTTQTHHVFSSRYIGGHAD